MLFFDSLDVYRLLLLAFLRLLCPTHTIRAIGIVRYDPLHADGTRKRKYAYLCDSRLGRIFARVGLKNTQLYTDSSVLREVLREHFRLDTPLAPIPIPGIWDLPSEEFARPADRVLTVGFIGQPRSSRAFPLFLATALAFESERIKGQIQFLVVTPPGSLETWGTAHARPILACGLAGLTFEERVMDSVDFARQMNRADIVWALGDPPDSYRRQTSGIFTHGLCLGKKLITDRGGWAEKTAGVVSLCRFVEPRLEQTIQAIRTLTGSKCDPNSLECIGRWRATHSQEAFNRFVASALGHCGIGSQPFSSIAAKP